MNIIYITSACSQRKFDCEVSIIKNGFAFQNQKFHYLLINGLSSVSDLSVTVVSTYPVERTTRIKRYAEEVENSVKYIYPSFINVPIIHRFCRYKNTKIAIQKAIADNTIIVCNVLDYDQCIAVQDVRKSCPKVKIVGIVTDLPDYSSGASFVKYSSLKKHLSSILKSYYNNTIFNYDAYLFLAEPMNNVVNLQHRPFCVIEGFSDINMKDTINRIEEKYSPKVLLYTGGIHAEYGIKRLVEAFEDAHIPGWELHIYGNGNYKDTLIEKCKFNESIKYFGVRSNKEIIGIQLRASLLINPRPTDEEYVKYSFPSKTMEYMASGTPLLSTKLPSMPDTYYPYIFTIDNETHQGFIDTLQNVLIKDDSELYELGAKAKRFILENKNNIDQARKFYNFLLSL